MKNLKLTSFAILAVMVFIAHESAEASNGRYHVGISAGYSSGGGWSHLDPGYAYRGGVWGGSVCGASCNSFNYHGAQYAGLPSALPKVQIPTQYNYSGAGWYNGRPGYPGGGWNGRPYPMPGPGYPGGGWQGRYPMPYPGGGGSCGGAWTGGGACGRYPAPYFNGGGIQGGMNHVGIRAGVGYRTAYPMPGGPIVNPNPCFGGCSNGTGLLLGGGYGMSSAASSIWAVSAGLSSMTSNVYPVAFPRQDFPQPEPFPFMPGPRNPGFEPRPGLNTHGGSAFSN